jgi:hypothetical protein
LKGFILGRALSDIQNVPDELIIQKLFRIKASMLKDGIGYCRLIFL